MKRITCYLLFAAFAIALVPRAARADVIVGKAVHTLNAGDNSDDDPGVVPVNSKPYGLSYGQWSAKFWQWEFSLPITNHPLFLDGTVDCSTGQSGPVWFIGGTFTTNTVNGITTGKANRTCLIPSGKAIFFPIVNVECSEVPGDNLGDTSQAGLRQCAMSFANLINAGTLRASIDGDEVRRLNRYRVQSPEFLLGPLPNDNIFQSFGLEGLPGHTYRSVSDGVHLMLRPLSPGRHTVKFYGEIDNPDGSKFIEDITYVLHVAGSRDE